MIYKQISEFEFLDAFDDYDRTNNFSIAGRKLLYDYLGGNEDDDDKSQTKLDVIAICCGFSEYNDPDDFIESHAGIIYDDEREEYNDMTISQKLAKIEKRLMKKTNVIFCGIKDNFVVILFEVY